MRRRTGIGLAAFGAGVLATLRTRSLAALAAVVFVALMGCTVGPNYVRPPVPEPQAYRDTTRLDESIADLAWWEVFGDSVLLDLIDTALENNRDLRATMARIDEAYAALGIVRASLFPRIDYAADGGIDDSTADGDEATLRAGGVLTASYLVDLWGSRRRSNEAAFQELLATEEAYRSVTIALVAQVANSYLLLRDLDNRVLISEGTVVSRQETVDVVQSRFDAGLVSEVDLNQAQIQLYEAEATVQVFERLRAQTENALSIILGDTPRAIERGLPLQDQFRMPDVPTGLPSALVERRPDVRGAERRLHAQTARIGVATALKYPQLTLSANLGGQLLEDANTGFYSAFTQIVGPLFNAGENQRRVEVEIARAEQLAQQYQQTILNAFREVEDALVAVRTYRSEYEARARQLAAATNAADLSWVRYEGGLTSYLEVLDLQRSLFSSQLKASETLQLELTSIVRLYEALGGGWVAAQDTLNSVPRSSQ